MSGGEGFSLVWSQKAMMAFNRLCVFVQATEGIIHSMEKGILLDQWIVRKTSKSAADGGQVLNKF